MKKLLLILPLLIVGCASTPQETYSKLYSSYEDFKAIAIAPGVTLEQNPYCFMGTGCEYDKTFICDGKKSLDEAKACSMEKCEKFYDINQVNDSYMTQIYSAPSQEIIAMTNKFDLGGRSFIQSPLGRLQFILNRFFKKINKL